VTDPIVSPDGQAYWSDRYGLWLLFRPAEPAAEEPAAERKSLGATAAARGLAVGACAMICCVVLLLTNGLPTPVPEILGAVPVLFLDYAADVADTRKIAWPASVGDLLRTRTWYLAGIGYAALLVIVADLEYVALDLVGGPATAVGPLDIATGVVMGILIGLRSPGHPVATIFQTAFLAGLLGTLFDLAVLGSQRLSTLHGGAPPAAAVLVNGVVFTVTGLLGYLGLRAVRRLRPTRLLASPDGHQVWDGTGWRRVGPDGRSYWNGESWVAFTPRQVPSPPGAARAPS
jgi:hypothetical protein